MYARTGVLAAVHVISKNTALMAMIQEWYLFASIRDVAITGTLLECCFDYGNTFGYRLVSVFT